MTLQRYSLFLLFVIIATGISTSFAQSADERTPLFPSDRQDEPKPRRVREMMIKMRIERDKKEFDQMIERSEEALKLADELVASVQNKDQLTPSDLDQLENVEKLVKKIRGELGGDDDDDDDSDMASRPTDLKEAIKHLSSATSSLVDELKRMTRFSISAAAIKTSNAIIRLSRFLRSGK